MPGGDLYANEEPYANDGHYANEGLTPVASKLHFSALKSFLPPVRVNEISRYFSGDILEKAILTIDKSTALIIGTAWLVAMVAMGIAFVAVRDTAQLKLKVEVASALDPVLPKIVRMPLNKEQYEPLLQRLKKQFPTLAIEISAKSTLRVQSNNSDEFMAWLNAVNYVDSMVSTVRWTLTTFCVGVECPGDNVMQAELTAEAINITQPEITTQ